MFLNDPFHYQAQEKTVDDLWKLVRDDVKEEEDDGFGIVDAKKKQKLPKKINKKVMLFQPY